MDLSKKLNGLDLFSGIGGISYALQDWVRSIAYCEIEPYCQSVLLSRMQEGDLSKAPIWDDIRTLSKGDIGETVDIFGKTSFRSCNKIMHDLKLKFLGGTYESVSVMFTHFESMGQQNIITKRDEKIKQNEAYLFHPGKRWNKPYTENRIRQIFQCYINKAGLQQVYGKDTMGRNLEMFTVHSLRHSHVTHYVIDRKLPLPIVQKQVGHRSLKTTSVYLSPSTEKMAQAYKQAHLKVEAD